MNEENVLHPLLRVVRCVRVYVRVSAPPGRPAVASNCLALLLRTCRLIESYTCYWQVQVLPTGGRALCGTGHPLQSWSVIVCLFTSASVLSMWMSVSVFLRERDRCRQKGRCKILQFCATECERERERQGKVIGKCCCVLGSRERDEKGYSCEMRIRIELIW